MPLYIWCGSYRDFEFCPNVIYYWSKEHFIGLEHPDAKLPVRINGTYYLCNCYIDLCGYKGYLLTPILYMKHYVKNMIPHMCSKTLQCPDCTQGLSDPSYNCKCRTQAIDMIGCEDCGGTDLFHLCSYWDKRHPGQSACTTDTFYHFNFCIYYDDICNYQNTGVCTSLINEISHFAVNGMTEYDSEGELIQ